jgi:hypothetical protein
VCYNGDLELKSVPQANVVPLSGTITVTPRNATIAQVIANKDTWASSLVKVTGVTITQGSSNPVGTNYTLTDASGTITMFVRTASLISVATGNNKTITGYITIYNSAAELVIRSAADIQ